MTRILIVDNNEDVLHMLQTYLGEKGYEVDTAVNGIEALDVAAADSPDIVISDIFMPVMDGFEFCREWKSREQLSKVPFVFFTGTYLDPKDEEFAMSLGVERFIAKPADMQEFLKILEEVLEKHQRGELISQKEVIPDRSLYEYQHSQSVIRNLEARIDKLEQDNRALREQLGEHAVQSDQAPVISQQVRSGQK